VTEIDFAYFNYEHGGLIDGRDHFFSSGRGYDFSGLIRVAGSGGRWPHVLVMGEGDRYEFNGQKGAREAARALRRAGGRAYEPLFGSLPREGAFAPVVFIDPQTIEVCRWYDHRAPDFALRNHNVLMIPMAARCPPL
jgi:hypothetical protein